MPTAINLLPAMVSAVTTMMVLPVVVWALRRQGVMDVPNERSSHTIPTPRGAGIAIAMGTSAGILTGGSAVLPLLVLVAGFTAIGLWSDLAPRPAAVRLMLQVTVGAALVGLLHPWAGPLIWFGSAFAVLAIVATANGVNFMDGINAISSIHAILWSGTYAWMLHRLGVDAVLPMALALGTSALVFLPWNVGHAKAFLGDAGSYLIGASVGVLAVLSIVNGGGIAGLLPLAVYAADTSTTLARRALRGEPVTTAHSDHTYQRLVPLVGSHAAVAAIVLGFSGACSFLGVLVLSATAAAQVIAVLATLGLVLLYLQLPSVARRCQARYHK